MVRRISNRFVPPRRDCRSSFIFLLICSKTTIQVEALLQKLPTCTNRSLIDEACVEFCYLNTKRSRQRCGLFMKCVFFFKKIYFVFDCKNNGRLVRTIYETPRDRLDLLPFYARLVASLAQITRDVSVCLCLRRYSHGNVK